MPQKLSFVDLKILESLAIYGPRNLTKVAKKLGMPPETLHKRFRRLRSQIFLRTHANLYHTNLGLRKAVVFAEAVPGYENLLFECLKQNDFWIAIARCYGMFEGCVSVFTIPKESCRKFEEFLREIKQLGVAKEIHFYWSTCFHSVHSRCNWFDLKSGTWVFKWENWINEIKNQQTKLPHTLVEPKDFPVLADKTDVLILKELEKDATISFENLAKSIGISPQLVRYHFYKHIVERGLLESFEVTVFHFGREASDFFFFVFWFDSFEKLAKFASSLLDKPFVKGLGKILGENALFGYLYLPRSEFRKFLGVLSKLIGNGFLKSYRYAIQDLEASSRQTISYEYFKDRKWIYNHEKHLKKLRNLIQKARPELAMHLNAEIIRDKSFSVKSKVLQ